MNLKIVAVVVLLVSVLGMAHQIEKSARPDTGRQGRHIQGGHEH